MSWLPFALALALTSIVQTAVLPLLGLPWIDLLLVFALVCGLTLPTPDARLAAWVTGFVQDLGSSDALGLHAFTLGLGVLALTYLRELVIRHHWWARFLICVVVAFPSQLIVQVYLRWSQGSVLRMLGESLVTAVVASLAAALVVGLPLAVGRTARRGAYSRW